MPDGHHDEVRRQIVGLNARSRLVEQIAVQLAGHLPLATRDETVAALRRHGPVKIGTRDVGDSLATAALGALRHKHPRLQWHTLGCHLTDSVPFWEAVGRQVPGGYSRRTLCLHTHPGG